MVGSRKFTRRQVLTMAGIAAAGTLLASCRPTPTTDPVEADVAAPDDEAVPAPAVVVKLRHQSREPEAAAGIMQLWNEFYPWFRDQNPNIEVEWLPQPAGYFEQTVAEMVAGTAADTIEHCCWQSSYFIERGETLNLQPFIDRDAAEVDMDDYYANQFDPWKDEAGDIHLMPRFTGTMVLFYNKDFFEERGIPELPKSWDDNIDISEYAEIGNMCKEREGLLMWGSSNYGMGANWLTQYHLRGWGTNMVDPEDRRRSNLDSSEALECLENIRKWIHDDNWFAYGAEMGGEGVMALFLSGRLGMMEMGPWELVNVIENATFRWDVAPIPKGPGGQTTHQSVDGSFIWRRTQHPEEAWTFMKAVTSPYYGRLYMRHATKQPSRVSLVPEFTDIMRDQYPETADVNLEVFGESMEKDLGGPEEMFVNDNVCKSEILQPAFDKVMLLNEMPVSVIGEASKIIERFNLGEVDITQIGSELANIGIR